MELKIDSKKQNPLFDRAEITASATGFTSTPSRVEVIEAMCKELGCNENCLALHAVQQPFGVKTARVTARVYNSPESLAKFESPHLAARGKKEKAPSEVAVEQKKEVAAEQKVEPAPEKEKK